MIQSIMSFLSELKVGARSLSRSKGLTITVVLTLAIGIGANAAMFSLVRAVLLRPLVNREEDRLIYIRQSAPGVGNDNAAFSVPEIQDLRSRVKTLSSFGDFSTVGFTMTGLGEPRTVQAGVVGGSYFEVMGLRPVLGRLPRYVALVLGGEWVLLMSLAVVGARWHTPVDAIGSMLLSVGVVTAGAAVFEPAGTPGPYEALGRDLFEEQGGK